MKRDVFYSDVEGAAVDVVGCRAFPGLARTAKVGPDVVVVVAIPCPGRNGTLSGSFARRSTPIQPWNPSRQFVLKQVIQDSLVSSRKHGAQHSERMHSVTSPKQVAHA